jgi:hypothetical protein
MSQIVLDWDFDYASVLEQKDGHIFEIGMVILETLAFAIVGCTYYHHMMPLTCNVKALKQYQDQVAQFKEELQVLHRTYPEISPKRLRQDTPRNPHFLDLAIPLTFAVPLLPTDAYQKQVLQKILPYTKLLKPIYVMEFKGRLSSDELASSTDSP